MNCYNINGNVFATICIYFSSIISRKVMFLLLYVFFFFLKENLWYPIYIYTHIFGGRVGGLGEASESKH